MFKVKYKNGGVYTVYHVEVKPIVMFLIFLNGRFQLVDSKHCKEI